MKDVYEMLADALRERDMAKLDAARMRDLLRSQMAGSTAPQIERMHQRSVGPTPDEPETWVDEKINPEGFRHAIERGLLGPHGSTPEEMAARGARPPQPDVPEPVGMNIPPPPPPTGTGGPPHDPPPAGRPDRPPASLQHPTRPPTHNSVTEETRLQHGPTA